MAFVLYAGLRIPYFLQMFTGGSVADFDAPSPGGLFPDIPVQTEWQSSDNLVSMNILYILICNSFTADDLIISTMHGNTSMVFCCIKRLFLPERFLSFVD
jgi:hypothetical protein